MAAESLPPETADAAEWRGDFRAAEERLLDLSLEATPAERLRWLEEALAFAARMAALRENQ
jgi:hypothetical protein